MKEVRTAKTQTLEAVAGTIMVLGAFAFTITFFPIINPPQYRLNSDGTESLWLRYLVGSTITAGILGSAFWLNQCAKRSHQRSLLSNPSEEAGSDGEAENEKNSENKAE